MKARFALVATLGAALAACTTPPPASDRLARSGATPASAPLTVLECREEGKPVVAGSGMGSVATATMGTARVTGCAEEGKPEVTYSGLGGASMAQPGASLAPGPARPHSD